MQNVCKDRKNVIRKGEAERITEMYGDVSHNCELLWE